MNRSITTILLLAALLLFLLSPFAALAPFLLILLGLTVIALFWNLVTVFFTGGEKP